MFPIYVDSPVQSEYEPKPLPAPKNKSKYPSTAFYYYWDRVTDPQSFRMDVPHWKWAEFDLRKRLIFDVNYSFLLFRLYWIGRTNVFVNKCCLHVLRNDMKYIMTEMSKSFCFLSLQMFCTALFDVSMCQCDAPVWVRALTKQRWQDDSRGATIYGELAWARQTYSRHHTVCLDFIVANSDF